MEKRNTIRNPYYQVAAWFGAIGIALSLVAGILVMLLLREKFQGKSWEGVAAAAMVSGILGLGLIVSTILVMAMARAINRFVAEIDAGRCLVHWRYTPEEWRAFQAAEAPLLKRDFRRIVLLPLLVGLPLGIGAFVIMEYAEKRGGGAVPVIAAVTVGFVILVAGLAYYFRVVRPRAWGRHHLLHPPASHLHLEFAHANGEFLYFNSFNQRLIGVELLEGPPAALEVTILSSQLKADVIRETKRILVPTGGWEKAAEAAAKLRQAWRLA